MSRVRTAIGAVAALTLGVALALWYSRPESPDAVAAAAPHPAQNAPAPVAEARATRADTALKSSADLARRFREADDLFAFASSIQAAARGGDGAALYYLHLATQRCIHEYAFNFGKGNARTLDQVLIDSARIGLDNADNVRELFHQCRGFNDANRNSFGDPRELLLASSKAGFPFAQALNARVLAEVLAGYAIGSNELRDTKAEVIALSKEAIRSRDPYVIYELARVQFALDPDSGEQSQEKLKSWLIAACERGFDCGPSSYFFQVYCRRDKTCQPYETLVDLFRRSPEPGFERASQLARELNEKLDQGRFDEISF